MAASRAETGAPKHRYDFVLLFDVQDGNPNGDPDAGNAPRVDPETGQGIVTDVAIKRRVRDYVALEKGGADGHRIYIADRAILALTKAKAYEALGHDVVEAQAEDASDEADPAPALDAPPRARGRAAANKPKAKKAIDFDRVLEAQKWMCETYYDVRTFGAVMSSKGADCGQVRGPVQVTFARSIDPVLTLDHTITRIAVETEAEAERMGGRNHTMGRKSTIPYGLYRAHGFVTPQLARGTGFSTGDLELFWRALWECYEHDRSASRGVMCTREVIVFEHQTELGNARAATLFDAVKVARVDTSKPARAYTDYAVSVGPLPPGVVRAHV
jgi:CRISPR-associated protein Csd2